VKSWARIVMPIIFGAAFLGAWEALVRGLDLKPYFLVAPSAIGDQFVSSWSLVWRSMKVSGGNALVGLLVGTTLGVAVSLVTSRFRLLYELVTPLAVALNAIPIFVLVSVFNNMFAITSEVPRRLMVTLVVYFVVLVNVTRGLVQVDRLHVELMRSYAASDWQVLRRVRIPNAVPYLFTALRIAAPVAVITAFVSEYFGGSQNGLGSAIARSIAASRNDQAWAYVAGACLLGLTFYLISTLLETVATPGGAGTRSAGRS
jgi:NitT/TauT family transport system permease protein